MERRFKCVLLVDDDDISNYISEKIIKTLKISESLKVLNNGRQALQFLKESCVELKEIVSPYFILLDINMPVMDGFQFLEEFNKLPLANKDQVKIVMLTSSNSSKDVEVAKRFNIHGYINKPLNREKLEKVLVTIN